MYNDFFGFREAPFSIAPDPRYLYLSERHKEALAHLMYGVRGQGGFIVITGEVGTGKTTVCRCFLESVPDHVDIALVLNPKLSARELLASICDELQLRYPAGSSIKRLIDLINGHLLSSHSQGRHTVLVIDEAQNLSADVLEQLRLLTNLETGEKKLLQIVLLGQPELQDMLAAKELRQLSQRVTARYHLEALDRQELYSYLRYRLTVAGSRQAIFEPGAIKALYKHSAGVPRLVNLIADRALLGAYAQSQAAVEGKTVHQAAREVLGERRRRQPGAGTSSLGMRSYWFAASAALVILAVALVVLRWHGGALLPLSAGSLSESVAAEAPAGQPEQPAVPGSAQPAASVSAEVPDGLAAAPAADSRPPTVSETSAILGTWQPGGGDSREAYQALFQAWGLNYDRQGGLYACDFAEQQGMRCLHRQGNWRSLEQLDRPAVLRLHNSAGDAYHAVLLKLQGDSARIVLGSQEYPLPRAAIDQHWLGDYSVVWRLPPYEPVTGNQGMDKTEWLQWAMQSLREKYRIEPELAESLAQATLKDQVIWFQRRAGLIPDGIPGAVTLIRINNELDPSGPRLSSADQPEHIAQQD